MISKKYFRNILGGLIKLMQTTQTCKCISKLYITIDSIPIFFSSLRYSSVHLRLNRQQLWCELLLWYRLFIWWSSGIQHMWWRIHRVSALTPFYHYLSKRKAISNLFEFPECKLFKCRVNGCIIFSLQTNFQLLQIRQSGLCKKQYYIQRKYTVHSQRDFWWAVLYRNR